MDTFDIAVIGAGAAGMMCAAVAGQLGRRVILLDHATKLAEKIRISGGGRCNFTNIHASPANYLSENPHFCRSALARYTPHDFLALLSRHKISWHEKHKGQLFCDTSSTAIINMLERECETGHVQWMRPVSLHSVQGNGDQTCRQPFRLVTSSGDIATRALVVATGGLSIPAIGATDLAYRLAQQFGINVIPPRPALVPFTLTSADWVPFAALSGLSLDVSIKTIPASPPSKKAKPLPPTFTEAMLFTHRGLSGPAVLQISSYWESGNAIQIDLLPGQNSTETLLTAKSDPQQAKQQLAHWLASRLPARFVTTWLSAWLKTHRAPEINRLADLSHQTLSSLGQALTNWTLKPAGTEGWRKAEVTRGGIDTRELSSTSMMAKRVPGLYFIGEAVDVTGWLGGYNFQWAWASGVAAAQAAAEATR